MGLYWRTIEMSRHRRFSCYRCGPDVVMRERFPSSTEVRERLTASRVVHDSRGVHGVELTCDRCTIVLLIIVNQAIPSGPDDLASVVRYRPDGRPLDPRLGLRCPNFARLLVPVGKGELGGRHDCPRCRTTHFIGSATEPT